MPRHLALVLALAVALCTLPCVSAAPIFPRIAFSLWGSSSEPSALAAAVTPEAVAATPEAAATPEPSAEAVVATATPDLLPSPTPIAALEAWDTDEDDEETVGVTPVPTVDEASPVPLAPLNIPDFDPNGSEVQSLEEPQDFLKSQSGTAVASTSAGGLSLVVMVAIVLGILTPPVLIYIGIIRHRRAEGFENMPAASESNVYRAQSPTRHQFSVGDE